MFTARQTKITQPRNSFREISSSQQDASEEVSSSIGSKRKLLDNEQEIASNMSSASECKHLKENPKLSLESTSDASSSSKAIPNLPKEVNRFPHTLLLQVRYSIHFCYFFDIFQVVTLILKWLSSSERKNPKLVCKEWYDAGSTYEKEEKLSIGSEYSSDDLLNLVFSTLSKSTRQCFHLEFYGLYFGKNPRVDFWRSCGPRILSLKLVECQMLAPPFANILTYCSRLQSLEFYFVDLRNMKEGFGIKVPSKSIPLDLKNLSLRTLKIDFKFHEWYTQTSWLHVLQTLFQVFPGVSNFSFCQYDLHCGNDIGSRRRPSQIFHHFSNLRGNTGFNEFQIRKALLGFLARDQMESIAMNFLFYPEFHYDSLGMVELTK